MNLITPALQAAIAAAVSLGATLDEALEVACAAAPKLDPITGFLYLDSFAARDAVAERWPGSAPVPVRAPAPQTFQDGLRRAAEVCRGEMACYEGLAHTALRRVSRVLDEEATR